MVIAAASSLTLGRSQCQLCHADGFYCSTSYGAASNWMKSPSDSHQANELSSISFRNKNLFLGSAQFQWSSMGHDLSFLKVSVAADYSDSVPDSSNYTNNGGYHPLEEVKINKRIPDTQLTSAEIAKTTVEANSSALLVFPGTVHCEPHEQISWADFEYIFDDYGDIFFEIFDDKNILEDPGASNPVNVLIGMDIPMYENKRVASEYNVFNIDGIDDVPFDDDYFEVTDSEISDVSVDWGMPDTLSWLHPSYFAKCLTKAISTEHESKMDHPSNGVSIMGCLRPAFSDEEAYIRSSYLHDNSDGYSSEWKDGQNSGFTSRRYKSRFNFNSTLYKLEIMRIELFSMYGTQSAISLQEFQDAEPDVLVHSTLAILDHFCEKGISWNAALKALCKKKGLQAEGANLVGVDSLGMDVRIFSGTEFRTHRFPFKARAMCEGAAEKQIQQLLFPRSRRKKLRTHVDRLSKSKSY